MKAKKKPRRKAPQPDKCGAKKKQGGGFCTKDPAKGKKRCYMHGGKGNDPGPSHHAWKHGRRSKFTKHLPARMRASFEASVNDPDILSVRSELALIDARLHDLLDRLNTGESADRMGQLSGIIDDMAHALTSKKLSKPRLQKIQAKAQEILEESMGEDNIWAKIRGTISSRIHLTDTERRLLETRQANVDAERLLALLNMVLTSVRQHVRPLPGGGDAVTGVADDLFKMLGLDPGHVLPEDLN